MVEAKTFYDYDHPVPQDRVLIPVTDAGPPVPLGGDIGWNNRQLTPMNQPIPIVDGFVAPNWKAVPKRTPKDAIDNVVDNQGKLLYKSVKIGYVVRTLQELFPSGYGEETIEAGWADPNHQPGEDGEYRVAIQIVAPGLFRPVMGVGSNVYQPSKNKQDTEAKTIASAYTSALKNAAKKLNIGRDFSEDDQEFVNRNEERIRVIDSLIKNLNTKGKKAEVVRIVEKHDPTAILGEDVVTAMIDAEKLETVQRDLQRVLTSSVRAAAN